MFVCKQTNILVVLNQKVMQTIVDMLVKVNGTIQQVTSRSNNEHIVNGANTRLIFEGLPNKKIPSDTSANIGDSIDILDYMGCKISSGTVLAKCTRLWDMSKPVGERCVQYSPSENWAALKLAYDKKRI